MKQGFAKTWKASTQPRKQRKFAFNTRLHERSQYLNLHLSKPLREKHATRSIRVRTGDKVKVLRGQFKGKEGKVESVDMIHTIIFVENIELAKKDGSKTKYPLKPSNLMITELNLAEDKKRVAKLASFTKENQK